MIYLDKEISLYTQKVKNFRQTYIGYRTTLCRGKAYSWKEKLIKEVIDPQTLNPWESFFINGKKMDLVYKAELKPINSRLFTFDNRLKRRTEPQPTRGQDRISTTSEIHNVTLEKYCTEFS